jgi:flagellar biosynthesis/type III secretory pathway M-ring protein FliF/YscJ
MEQIRLAMANIQRSLGRVGPTQKLLFASLAVIAAMTLFLVSQYAAKPAMVDLMADSADMQLVDSLRAAGVEARVENGRLMVPAGDQRAAVAALSEAGQLPGDTTILFNNLIQSQDWKASREQHRQQAVIALQNELSRVISQFRGVRRATVILDIPEPMGLGRAVREPSASVSVQTAGGAALSQETVDAIAGLVAGSRAGLEPRNVQVIDATTGRPRQVSDEDTVSAGKYLDHKMQVERYTQREIERLLSHIPGVVVSVNAVVDVTRVASTRQRFLPDKEGSVAIATRRSNSDDSTTQAAVAAEPGTRAYGTADINSGSTARGAESSTSTEDSEFEVQIGSETTQVVDPRGMPTRLSASVMIPQGYVEALIRQSRPDDQDEEPVTGEDADAFFQSIKPMLERSILTRLETVDPEGQVLPGRVELGMAAMPMSGVAQAGFLGVPGGASAVSAPGGIGGIFSAAGAVETIVLAVLGLVSVAMMFSMVRRAGRKPALPTAEELVGVPPALEVAGDLVGEADESDAAMAGIEISEEEVKLNKMRELVAEMINTNPEAAASLVGRWINEDE